MNVIVDTCVWSLALRRSGRLESGPVEELQSLIRDHRVRMLGPIRQELLSGIREMPQFSRLRDQLTAFPDLPILMEDYVTAAAYFNLCRSRGVQGSNTDFLICAVAVRMQVAVFTTDQDFAHFAKHLPLTLHKA